MSSRPNTTLGINSTYVACSVNEPDILVYITEGEKEEIQYLKGLELYLKERDRLSKSIVCVNEKIDKSIVSCSHPLKRMDALLNYLNLNYPVKPQGIHSFIICDLDSGSFKSSEQAKLISLCQNNNINIILSNPAFQLWLVFHFYTWLREGIYDDSFNCKKQIQFLERMLKRRLKGYEHGKLDFSRFPNRIGNAIINSNTYQTTVNDIRADFGTNFMDIVIDMGF